MLQAIYLCLDIVESVTEKVLYGIIAASFMMGLGFFILVVTGLEYYHTKELEMHGIIEGMFYLLFGAALLGVRLHNKNEEDEEEKKEEEEEKKKEEKK